MKILIIRFSSMGDIIFTTPALRNIKRKYPKASISYFTKKQYKYLLERNPNIDHLFFLEDKKNVVQWAYYFNKKSYDFIYDLHNSLRSRILSLCLFKKVVHFKKDRKRYKDIIEKKIFPSHQVHIADRIIQTFSKLNIQADSKSFDFFLPKDVTPYQKQVADFTNNETFTAFIIGASTFTKRMPNEDIVKLIKLVDGKCILLGGRDVAKNGQDISQHFSNEKVLNTCGVWGMYPSVLAIKYARSIVGFDTGLSYIAQAFNKKLCMIWGGTDKRLLGVGPYHISHFYNAELDLACRPCSKFGLKNCPENHFSCMKNHNIIKIADFINGD